MDIMNIIASVVSAAGVLALAGVGLSFFVEWARYELTGATR